jgi:tetratricopeptide (TPR) repeat protein
VFAVTIGFLAARFECEPERSEIFTEKPMYLEGSFSAMLRVQPRIWAYQLGVLFWPDLLCADKTSYTIKSMNLTTAFLILVVTVIGTFVLAYRNSAFGLGAAFYWLALLPVSNLVPMFRPMADRYLYFPMVGVCLACGAIVCRLKIPSKRWVRALLIVSAAAVYGILSVLTIQRTLVWQNERSLWEDTVEKNPYSFTANSNLGFILYDDGEFYGAMQAFKRVCSMWPDYAEPWAGLAITYDALQLPDLAEEALRQAIARDERYADPASLVGTLILEKRFAERLQIVADRIIKH